MASFRKTSADKWRAEIVRNGLRKSKVFATKTAAKEWAAREEYLILNSEQVQAQGTFGDAMDRYERERSPAKRGARWESIRLIKMGQDKIAQIKMADLRSSDFADWRDQRMRQVSPGTVIREMQIMSAVLTVCVKEWQIIPRNPLSDVRRPKAPPGRDRLVTDEELQRLEVSAGTDLSNATARAYHAFRLAVETGMRAGEIIGLTQDRVDLERRVVRLDETKNGTSREVPLSSEAVRLIKALPVLDPVFGLNSAQLDALWRKLRDRAHVEGLTFHDSRHSAITRLSKKLDVLALARMVGHRNLKQLQTYYNESAEELAKRLD